MKPLLLLSFLFSLNSFASNCEKEYKFTVDGKETALCLLKEKAVLVSFNCEKAECEALKSFQKNSFKKIRLEGSELKGGKNPSTLLCKKLEGKLLLGISELEHQQYFCEFSDGSLISTASLYSKYQN